MSDNIIKTIHDEYEESQLNPIYVTDKVAGSHTAIKDVLNKIPARTGVEMRAASFEAIVDDLADSVIEDNGATTTYEDVEEVVQPVVDNAVELRLVPTSFKAKVRPLIMKKLNKTSRRVQLLEKAAYYMTEAVTDVEDGAAVIDEVSSPVVVPQPPVEEEIVTPDSEEITTSDNLPEEVADTMKYMAASAINTRKAVAMCSRRVSGPILYDTLFSVRHLLPDSYKRKLHM